MWKVKNSYKVLVENMKRRDHFGYGGIDGRIMLKWVLNRV